MSVPNKFGFWLRPGSQHELTALQPSLKRLGRNINVHAERHLRFPGNGDLKPALTPGLISDRFRSRLTASASRRCFFRIAVRGKNTRKFAKHLSSYWVKKIRGASLDVVLTGESLSKIYRKMAHKLANGRALLRVLAGSSTGRHWQRYECVGGPFDGQVIWLPRAARNVVLIARDGSVSEYLNMAVRQFSPLLAAPMFLRAGPGRAENRLEYSGWLTEEEFQMAQHMAGRS